MREANGPKLGDIINLEGLEKPQKDVRAIFGEKGGKLMYGEISGLADRIEGSENVELGEVRGLVSAIRENIEGMKVFYFGDELTWEQYDAIENLPGNTKACREIERTDRAFGVGEITYLPNEIAVKLSEPMKYGDLTFNSLKNLTVTVARELAKRKSSLGFPSLTEISPDVAAELASLKMGGLHLNGLEELSIEAAAELAKFKGSHLYLDGLKRMPAEVAAEMAKCQSDLSLNGIEEMEVAVAKALSTHKGGLTLGGFERLTPGVAAQLAKTGRALQFWKLKKMDKETARELGAFSGYLGLAMLEDMDEEIAKELANQRGILYLIGLKEFKPGVAAALGKHRGGGMVFHQVTRITEEDARGLAQHRDGMRLAGVTDISEEAAKILGESGVEITRMSEMMEEKVNRYKLKKKGL